MSSLKVHTIQSVTASAVLYPVMGANVIPFGLAAVFIDLDHVIEYMRDTRSIDLRGLFAYYSLLESNVDKDIFVLNIFHTIEFFLFFFILTFYFPALIYVFAGFMFHFAADLFHLIVTLRTPFLRAFSVFEYLYRRKKGKHVLSVKELLQKENLSTDTVRDLQTWMRRWGVVN